MKQIFASFFAVLFGAFLAQAADDHITYEGKEGPGKGKHIVLLSGDEEYRSEEGLPCSPRSSANVTASSARFSFL